MKHIDQLLKVELDLDNNDFNEVEMLQDVMHNLIDTIQLCFMLAKADPTSWDGNYLPIRNLQ